MKLLAKFTAVALLGQLVLIALLVAPREAFAVGTLSGTSITNTATTTYQDANSNSYTANSNTVTVTVSSVFNVSLTCAANKNANSNTVAYYACTLTNTGNVANTYTLSSASTGWTTELYADNGAGGGVADDGNHQSGETTVTGSTGLIAADAVYKFFLAVTVPAGTANGTTGGATLNVVGGDAGAGDDTSASLTTTALAPALTVAKKVRVVPAGVFADSGTARPSDVLEYQVRVTNGGAVQATNVVLQDTLDANLTFVADSLYVGDSSTYNGGSNVKKTDTSSDDPACAADACGAANYNSGTKVVTFNLGTGATENSGGSLSTSSTVYVYYRATVN